MKITLAYPWTDADGKTHKADATVDMPDAEAHDLIFFGRARVPEPATRKKETA